MKIVDRKTFLELPAGALYAKYEPCIFGELAIKGGTCRSQTGEPIDWFYQELSSPWFDGVNDSLAWADTLDAIQGGEAAPAMDYECESRDGLFDDDQLFAVWEAHDLNALIGRLLNARTAAYSVLSAVEVGEHPNIRFKLLKQPLEG